MEFFRKGKRHCQAYNEPEGPADITNAITYPWNVLRYEEQISVQDAAILRRMLSRGPPVWRLVICDISLRAFKVAFDDLEECPSLKHVHFRIDCEGNDLGTNISRALRGVRSFGLNCRSIGSQFPYDIASYIRQENSWKELFLSSTCGGNQGAAVIIEALAENTTLQIFTLDDMTLSSDTLVRLSKMLASNSTLQEVRLNESCRVEKAAVSALLAEEWYAYVFKRIQITWPEELLPELTMLICREACCPRLLVNVTSSVDERVLGEFFQAVAADRTILWLCFDDVGNTFDALADGLAFVVKHTKTLRVITNSMGVRRGEEHQLLCVLDSLKENCSVTEFVMCTESMTPEIATSLSELLILNNTLQKLIVCEDWDISASDVETVLQGLRANHTLSVLKFYSLLDDFEGIPEVEALLKRNAVLSQIAMHFVLCGGDAHDKEGLDAWMKIHPSPGCIQELEECSCVTAGNSEKTEVLEGLSLATLCVGGMSLLLWQLLPMCSHCSVEEPDPALLCDEASLRRGKQLHAIQC
ncbi:hypothetical protein HPB50_008034 [Hyalomma asiaticum]|uniref:Uncharacterized protein n=1 Tax=Hyalomma asiaticum TaxID=266040 RepID=A0ACB7RMC1_HYAAI|nr:hypothetical protein HPB50_008034 [Hyalomma asiaticum]